jgi:hypothetical protein
MSAEQMKKEFKTIIKNITTHKFSPLSFFSNRLNVRAEEDKSK